MQPVLDPPVLPYCSLHRRLHPGEKTGVELVGVEGGKHVAKRVVRGNTVAEVEKACKPLPFGLAELHDFNPRIGTTDHGAQSNREHGEHGMVTPTLGAGISARGKVCGQRGRQASSLLRGAITMPVSYSLPSSSNMQLP